MRESIKLITLFIILIPFLGLGQSVGGITSGSASYCPGTNSGFISLSSYNGSILYWESSSDNIIWNNLGNPTPTQSYLNLTQTTYYRAIVQDGAFPADTSTSSIITIYEAAVGGVLTGGGAFCLEATSGTLTLTGETGSVLYWLFSTDSGNSWTQIANTNNTFNYSTINQNTIYSVVVQNEPSCPNDTSGYTSIYIDQVSDAGNLGSDDTIACLGENKGSIVLSGEYGAIVDWIYSEDSGVSWSSLGTTLASVNFSNLIASTNYQAIVQNGVCPFDSSNVVSVNVYSPETVSAGLDESIENHGSIALQGAGNGIVSWSPTDGLSDPTLLTPDCTPLETTTYTITLEDSHGCVSSDSVTITVNFPIPSAITPNNDGVNDVFLIDNIENLSGNSLVIYNRQGNIVYKKAPYDNSWNGKNNSGQDLSDGIYYYLLDYGDGSDIINGYVLVKR